MTWPCRCWRCNARYSQDRNPEHEDPPILCLCGGKVRVDWYRKNKERKGKTCSCDGYRFPHRTGSKDCKFDKDGVSRFGPLESSHSIDETAFPF